jgi:hypothetical protein
MITFAPFPEIQRPKQPRRSKWLLMALFLTLTALSGLVVLWSF